MRHWKYTNSLLLILSIIAVIYLANTSHAITFVQQFAALGLFGGFIVGVFFVFSFTTAPALLVIYHLAQTYDPVALAIATGLGGVVGDFAIYKFLKQRVFTELEPLFKTFDKKYHLQQLLATPFFVWLTPLLGALVITSPFPDEIGIALLGISKLKTWQFLLLTFVLDVIGMLLIVFAFKAIA
jgi:hypothetical protein